MPFFIFFYLIVVCNLATCFSANSEMDDEINSSTGCLLVFSLAMTCRHMNFTKIQLPNNLTKLELIDVHIAVLDEDFIPVAIQSDLLYLRNLSWTNSNIRVLQSISIPNLQELDLSWNVIEDIQPNAFSLLANLRKLNMSHNNIERLPENVFDALTRLEILDLSNNRLSQLEDTIFNYNSNLLNLNLGFNQLSSLPSAVFQSAFNLQSLSLQHNNLDQLPNSIVDIQLKHLYLDGNPWPCDCSVQWIPLWALHASNITDNLLHLNGYCNGTSDDLLLSLQEMQCKPTIVRVSEFSYHTLDATVRLVCRVYANPQPSVDWITPNSFELPPLTDSANPTLYVRENGDLNIGRMSRYDAGEYVCMATNQVGKASAHTRLYIDPSIFRRIKTGSVICGLVWVHTFLLFSIFYLLIRRFCRRSKYDLSMQEGMDAYKLQQLTTLREHCRSQMDRIKNNCSTQVDQIKENHPQSGSAAHPEGISAQMAEIRDSYLTQMQQVRDHYREQRNLIREYTVDSTAASNDAANDPATCFLPADVSLVKMENGAAAPEDDNDDLEIYKYNDTLKDEIRALTCSHQIPGHVIDSGKPTTSFHNQDQLSNGNLGAAPQDQDEDGTSST